MVLEAERDGIAARQAMRSEQVSNLVRHGLEFTVRHHLTGLGHDEGWVLGRVCTGIHGVCAPYILFTLITTCN